MGKNMSENTTNDNGLLPTSEDLVNNPMTPEQFSAWLKAMEIDTTEEKLRQAGVALDKSTRQLRKYISGVKPIPRSVGLACLLLLKEKTKKEKD